MKLLYLLKCPCCYDIPSIHYEGLNVCFLFFSEPPSSPLPGTVTTNSTDAVISWATPLDLGGRSDQYYR